MESIIICRRVTNYLYPMIEKKKNAFISFFIYLNSLNYYQKYNKIKICIFLIIFF